MTMRPALTWGLLATLLIAGCVTPAADPTSAAGEGASDPNADWALLEVLTGFDVVGQIESDGAPLEGVTGLWLHDDIAYLSGPAGLRIVDVRDPTAPVVLNAGVEDTSSRDVDIMVHPDGRTYAALSAGGIKLVDVTEPDSAFVVSSATVSSHNMAVVPNTTIVYNSRSISTHVPGAGETGQVDLVDFADPANPVVKVFVFPAVIITPGGTPRTVASSTCHDITFNPERGLAYCAGVTDTTIWDISDPWSPVIIQVIDYPLVNIHHAVWPARGGDLLILGDEFGGALAGPMCNSNADYPTSALWFFDVTDMETPTPVDYFQVEWDSATNDDGPNAALCTTHFGTLIEGHDAIIMSWYTAGTVLVDFGDVKLDPNFGGAKQLAHFRPAGAVNTWEAREYKGYIYTGDTSRGTDVLKLI